MAFSFMLLGFWFLEIIPKIRETSSLTWPKLGSVQFWISGWPVTFRPGSVHTNVPGQIQELGLDLFLVLASRTLVKLEVIFTFRVESKRGAWLLGSGAQSRLCVGLGTPCYTICSKIPREPSCV